MDLRAVIVLLLLPAVLAGCKPAETPPPEDRLTIITREVDRIAPSLIELRRDIRRHPEISGQEERTAGLEPDAFFAIHTAPMPVGSILVTPGGGLAGFQGVEVSWPKSLDVSANVGAALESVSTLPPFDAAAAGLGLLDEFISVQLTGEPTEDAQRRRLRAMIRVPDVETFADAQQRITTAIENLGHDDIDVRFDEEILPPMKSDPTLARQAVPALQEVLGEAGVQVADGTVPYFGEDFVFFGDVAPIAMFLLGVANPERGIRALNHSPDYDLDEAAIALGTKAMANVITRYAEAHAAAREASNATAHPGAALASESPTRGSIARLGTPGVKWIGTTDGWHCKARAIVGDALARSTRSSEAAPAVPCT